MTRTVADAALLLSVMAGTDAADPSTAESDARRADYAALLEQGSLRGRRLGILRSVGGADDRGRPLLDAVVATLHEQGAELIDPVELRPDADYSADETTVLLYEFKADLDSYLQQRGLPAMNSLADVIAFNEREAPRELRWFGQELMLDAQRKGGLDAAEYRAARKRAKRLAGPQGIDAVLRKHKLDALVALTVSPAGPIDLVNGDNWGSSFGSSTAAAVAGYPSVTVPAGFVHGLPVGVSFFAGAWADAQVLALAHAFEQAHAARRPPTFLPTLGDGTP
jgi:amidase